jgi:hypothetical protein
LDGLLEGARDRQTPIEQLFGAGDEVVILVYHQEIVLGH